MKIKHKKPVGCKCRICGHPIVEHTIENLDQSESLKLVCEKCNTEFTEDVAEDNFDPWRPLLHEFVMEKQTKDPRRTYDEIMREMKEKIKRLLMGK